MPNLRVIVPVMLAMAQSLCSSALAQRVTVIYDHSPGAAGTSGRVHYQKQDDPEQTVRGGLPQSLDLAAGGEACVKIESGNALLYDYSLAAKDVKVEEPPADLAAITKVLLDLSKKGAGAWAAASGTQAYLDQVARLGPLYGTLESLRAASDSIRDFQVVVDSAKRVQATFGSVVQDANGEYQKVASDQTATFLKAQQTQIEKQFADLFGTFLKAFQEGNEPLCRPLKETSAQLVLSIKAKSFVKTPQRPTGDNVVQYVASVTSSKALDVAFGGLVGTLLSQQRRFSVANGVVQEADDGTPTFGTAAFVLARAWQSPWLWGSIGVSATDKGVQSLFFGFTGRFGFSVGIPQMSLGAGLVLARVPVELKQGAVGQPLPADVKNIDDIVLTKLRPGLGVMFTLVGLDLKK